jgi:predicted RNA-binding Zn ribbon-like protein
LAPRFQFVGGRLALDFVNTVGNRLNPEERRDYFERPEAVGEWMTLAGLERPGAVSARGARRLIALRELLYRVFAPLARHEAPARGDVAALARLAGRARSKQRLTAAGGGFAWSWGATPPMDRAVYTLALDATGLLLSDDCRRIRQCEDELCGWLFLDRSRGGRRRWCSMADCGNRAKARRHYSRQRRGLPHRSTRDPG